VSKSNLSDMAASVRQRLVNLSREKGEDFQLVLNWYGLERLLYRLGCSEHGADFVLKPSHQHPITGLGLWSRACPNLAQIRKRVSNNKVGEISGAADGEIGYQKR